MTGQAPDVVGRSAAQEQAVAIPGVRGVLNSIRVPGADQVVKDQRALQPTIGAGIYATDILIGCVDKVAVDPDNRLVTAILASAVFHDPDQAGSNWLRNEHRYLERKIMIPIESVRHENGTSVFLKEKSAGVAGFNDFDPAIYFPPSVDWEAPYPYRHGDVLLMREDGASNGIHRIRKT